MMPKSRPTDAQRCIERIHPVNKQHVRIDRADAPQLAGRLETPTESPRAIALIAHCFACGKDLKSANWLSQRLVERNIGVLRIDFTGLGDSQGSFALSNFSSNVADLRDAANWLSKEVGGPQLLMGHSLGGLAAICAAPDVPSCRAVATLATPSDTTHLADHLLTLAPDLARHDESPADVMGKRVTIHRQMLDDFRSHDIDRAVGTLAKPLLILHAPEDAVVATRHAHHLYALAQEPKSIVALHDADHLMVNDRRYARHAADLVAIWLDAYLD